MSKQIFNFLMIKFLSYIHERVAAVVLVYKDLCINQSIGDKYVLLGMAFQITNIEIFMKILVINDVIYHPQN